MFLSLSSLVKANIFVLVLMQIDLFVPAYLELEVKISVQALIV